MAEGIGLPMAVDMVQLGPWTVQPLVEKLPLCQFSENRVTDDTGLFQRAMRLLSLTIKPVGAVLF